MLSPCQVLPERHPSPSPTGHLVQRGSPGSRTKPGGGPRWFPRTLTQLFPPRAVLRGEDEPSVGEEEELVIRLPLAWTWCFICSLPSPFCPQWSHPFQKFSAGNREAGGEQELGELEKTALI